MIKPRIYKTKKIRQTNKKKKYPQFKKNDEYNTPTYAYIVLRHFLKPLDKKVIWDPFVSEDSDVELRMKRLFTSCGSVIYNRTFDLMTDNIPFFDFIITNPPFSIKQQVLEKLFQLNKPFCVLLPVETLGCQYMRDHFVSLDSSLIDIVIPRRRIQYTSSQPGVKM